MVTGDPKSEPCYTKTESNKPLVSIGGSQLILRVSGFFSWKTFEFSSISTITMVFESVSQWCLTQIQYPFITRGYQPHLYLVSLVPSCGDLLPQKSQEVQYPPQESWDLNSLGYFEDLKNPLRFMQVLADSWVSYIY